MFKFPIYRCIFFQYNKLRKNTKKCALSYIRKGVRMEKFTVYHGKDLGATYTPEKTSFRLWAPSAQAVSLCLYRDGDGDCKIAAEQMKKDEEGTWTIEVSGDLDCVYYTYLVTYDGVTRESQDPYAKAVGVNGIRSMVVDLAKTNPKGFEEDQHIFVEKPTDAILYELSVSDMTRDPSSGVKNAGKYLGLTEKNTKSKEGNATGLDHIKDLGVTHIQLMPSFDFGSIDEAHLEREQYNWGYDPVNYNVPEGSYSTDPFHGEVRIREFKQMVQAFHEAGIGVIMDVVYNHTYDIENNCFQKCVPDYYYRKDENGYTDASACGNEVASEKPMVRKFIVDSVTYWAKEYHIDGFRFDLMGILDMETMKAVRAALDEISPKLLVYGEGWTGGESPIPDELRAMKRHVKKIGGVGAFSDDIRDNTRGSVFYDHDTGFASGKQHLENAVRYSVVGACFHPQVDYKEYRYSNGAWANLPSETINYVSCHDNMTLWDKLAVSCQGKSKEERLSMNRLCAAMVMTAQGIPFFLSGEEMGRSKPIEGSDKLSENSFNLPAYTNNIRYENRSEFADLFSYYKGLIAFRKMHEGLRLSKAEEIKQKIRFVENLKEKNVVAFTIDTEKEILFIAYNAKEDTIEMELPVDGMFQVYVKKDKAGTSCLESVAGSVRIDGISCLVAVQTK